MNLLWEAVAAVGAVLLGVAAGLLVEELIFGGLARLLATWPGTGKHGAASGRSSSLGSKHEECNNRKGDGK